MALRRLFLTVPIFFALVICAPLSWAKCEPELESLNSLAILEMTEQPDPPGTGLPLRTIKTLTSGLHEHSDGTIDPREPAIDTADPSAPFTLTLPNGKRVVRIYFSGLRFLESDTLDDILKGGTQTVRRIRGFYADGTEMTGLYHQDYFPWDPELHVLDDGTMIAHGGVAPQPGPGQLPPPVRGNVGRTRMWAKVKFFEREPGKYEEHWIFQGSLFGHEPTFDNWVTNKHFHNYGATLFRWPDGSYVRDEAGKYIMVYERVTEERDRLPWNTEVFAVKVDPSLTTTVGPSVLVQSTRRADGSFFKVSERDGGRKGYLLEGGRPIAVKFEGGYRWIIAMSGGDFVSDRYGIKLAFSQNDQPISAYSPVVDANGEMIDFAIVLRCVLNATWGPGRPSLFYDDHGRMWMAMHFISKDQIPDGEVKSGWPRTMEEFTRRHRRAAVVPVKIVFQRGQPQLQLNAVDAKTELAAAIRRCEALN